MSSFELPTILLATSAVDTDAAYRLRYDVFSIEKGDYRYADIVNKTYIDPYDNDGSTLLIAKTNSAQVIGTVRIFYLRNGEYLVDGYFSYETIAQELGISLSLFSQHTAIISRLAVAPQYRRSGLSTLLADAAQTLCRAAGVAILLCSVKADNEASKAFVTKRSYKLYNSRVLDDGRQIKYFYKLL